MCLPTGSRNTIGSRVYRCRATVAVCQGRKLQRQTEHKVIPLDELDGFEGLIHVTDGQVEAEAEHGVAGGLLTALQTHKVPECSSGHHVEIGRAHV